MNTPSPGAAQSLLELEPKQYQEVAGLDGKGLRVPNDLDDSICRYVALSAPNRDKFDRATYWLDLAFGQWDMSISASYGSLVSAIESLTLLGKQHDPIGCPTCGRSIDHEVPGPTQAFKAFLETYAPGQAANKVRDAMFGLRGRHRIGSCRNSHDCDGESEANGAACPPCR
jgi:hypothetical protein